MTPIAPDERPSVEFLDRVNRFLDEGVSGDTSPAPPPFDGLDDVVHLLQATARDAETRATIQVVERIWAKVSPGPLK